jgi:feruloyl-CoA synthase
LRPTCIGAAAPLLQDVVLAGHDRDFIALLAWPNQKACRDFLGAPDGEPIDRLLRAPAIVEHIRAGFRRYNDDNPQSSARVARVLLMTEPPSIDGSEVTDKGYIIKPRRWDEEPRWWLVTMPIHRTLK